MTIAGLVVYILTVLHLSGGRQRRMIVWILLTLAFLHVAVGTVQFKEGRNFMLLPTIFRPDYESRASGFYICPNHLAGLLEMLGLLSVGFVCWGREKPWQRMLAIYGGVVCMAGVALTGSRGGYFSTIAGLGVFCFLSLWVVRRVQPQRVGRMALLALATCGAILAGSVFLMLYSANLKMRLGAMYDPANMRLHLWAAALKQASLNPIFGTGSGTYLFYGRQFRSPLVQADPIHVHCDYLELLAEFGIAGVLAFATFVIIHLWNGWMGVKAIVIRKLLARNRTRSNELALIIGALSGIAALLIHSVIDFNLHIPSNTLVVAFLFGLLASPCRAKNSEDSSSSRFRDSIRWLAPLLGLVLLAVSVPKISGEYYGEKARVALRDAQYPEALQFVNRALDSERKNPDLFYYQGEAQHYLAMDATEIPEQIQLHEAAATSFCQGLALSPSDLRLLLKAGRTFDNLGRFEEAERLFQGAVTADPNFGNVYAYYGLHCHLQKHFKKAREYYYKAIGLGEKEISTAGLRDLERDLKAPNDDVFSDSVADREMDGDTEDEVQ